MLDAQMNTGAAPKPRTTIGKVAGVEGDVLVYVLLIATILVGGYFRFVGLNWDDYTHLHPDERFLTDVASSLGRPLSPTSFTGSIPQNVQYEECLARNPNTNGEGGYFDTACSTLNPHNVGKGLYVYGTLPLFLARWTGDLIVQSSGDPIWSGYNGVHLVWRFLSAVSDMIALFTVFLIGQKLHGKWVGLLAAVLYAGAVFPIQQAHFGTTDAMSNMFAIVAILFAVRVQMNGRFFDYVLFGVFAGAALASRINIAPIVGLVVLAALLRALPIFDPNISEDERYTLLGSSIVGVIVAGIFTILVFRIFNPYAFNGPGFFGLFPNERWLDDILTARNLVSGAVEIPPNWQWVGRTAYVFPLQNMVLWGMGVALGVLGWVSWVWSGYRIVRGRVGSTLNILLVVWVLVYFGFLGRQWVTTMRYFLPLYPVLAVLAAWGLVELIKRAQQRPIRRALAYGLLVGTVGFTLLWAAMFTNIYRNLLSSVQSGHWVWERIPGDFYMTVEGADPDTPLTNIGVFNSFGEDNDLLSNASRYEEGLPIRTPFHARDTGTVTTIHTPHLGDPLDDPDPEVIRVSISDPTDGSTLSSGVVAGNFDRDNHPLGDAYEISLDEPIEIVAGQRYDLTVEVLEGGPVVSSGGVMAWEGDWDEVVPPKVCMLPDGQTVADSPPPGRLASDDCINLDAWNGLLTGYKMQLIYDDFEAKRELFTRILNTTDYIIIGTNRRYDSQSRIPGRWPMTMRYYETLFNGELGFELVAEFDETFELGPLRISDQYLPHYDAPGWLNELEAEEAFHVYDHPAVFIFQKTDDYSPENTHRILHSVPIRTAEEAVLYNNCPEAESDPVVGFYCDPELVGLFPIRVDGLDYSLAADEAPSALKFDDSRREIQYGNGTWSSRFDRDNLINTQPGLLIVVWWATVIVFGWAAFPLLFSVFPGLADRGYGLAKIAGLFITGWLAWYISSANIPLWSQTGVAIALLAVFVIGVLVLRHNQARAPDDALTIRRFIRQNWRLLLGIEAITLIAFGLFLLVRLTNPDLWHPSFGGEKPMDFAYFNGVLRSTVFPPVDPWYAGGYINYYYFGFVIAGAPVLLLGVVPSVAYNLLIPTLFAVTGIAAFSVAYNVVAAWRKPNPDGPGNRRQPALRGNPWVAGIMALLLATVMGNLDTPRVVLTHLGQMGGYTQPDGLRGFLVDEYRDRHGVEPGDDELLSLIIRADNNNILDRLRYEATTAFESVNSVFVGVWRWINGQPLAVGPERWFWGPTRVLAEPPVDSGGAIAEMPYFTFLYGDLHAHMIAMPLQFFFMGFLLNELVLAGRRERSALYRSLLAAAFALGIGALIAGMFQATNTWEWPTYMVLGTVGLVYIWILRHKRINRRALIDFVAYVGGFLGLSALLSLPYTTWYAAVYGSVRMWDGNRTPLWAYFDIHGLFLFLLVSLLIWDTGRWLRSVYVRSLRGTWELIIAGLILAGLFGLIVLGLTLAGYQVALIALPLLVWMAILFFRSGQTRPMRFLIALAGLATTLTLAVEFVVLAGDIGRQNTVFKFYIQVWLMFSIVGGVAFAYLLQSSDRWSPRLRGVWYSIAALLLIIAGAFPFLATAGKSVFRMAPEMPLTLDGMAYMQYATQYEGSPRVIAADNEAAPFALEDDYNVIRWLQDNVEGTPVIMEGRSEREYLWGGRISIYTGLPSVVGWNWHQRQQRTFNPLPRLVEQRVANVNAFYVTEDIATAWDIIQHFDVEYIIVSGLERAYYPPLSLAKFDEMVRTGLIEVVYEEGRAVIYRVVEDAQLQEVRVDDGLVGS